MKLVYNDTAHSYWLDGKRVKSASKVAKIAADNFTIEQWSKRQIAIGMTLDPTLAEQVAVDLDNREAIQAVCDAASEAAKAHNRARRGTQRHRVLELVLLEREDEFVTDQQRSDAEVLRRTLDCYQLEPMRDRVEQFVAWPEHGVVGRYDAIMKYQGAPALFDLKGGENAVKYPHSTAVQEALYLFAPHTSQTIERVGDRSTVSEWTTMPDDIDTEVAYVIYCDDEHDVGELWQLDMNHGYIGAMHALHIVDWRKKLDYGRALVKQLAAPVPAFGERPAGETPSTSPATPAVGDTVPPVAPLQAPTPPSAGGVGATNAAPDGPDTAPVDRRGLQHRRGQVRKAKQKTPDEGDNVGLDVIQVLKDTYNALPADAQQWVAQLVAEGHTAGLPWNTGGLHSQRRYHLGRAIVALAPMASNEGGEEHDGEHPTSECLLGLLEEATGREYPWNAVPLGAAIGSLDADEAERFAKLVDDYLSPSAA